MASSNDEAGTLLIEECALPLDIDKCINFLFIHLVLPSLLVMTRSFPIQFLLNICIMKKKRSHCQFTECCTGTLESDWEDEGVKDYTGEKADAAASMNPSVLMKMMYCFLPSSVKTNQETRGPQKRQKQRVQRQWVLSCKQCAFIQFHCNCFTVVWSVEIMLFRYREDMDTHLKNSWLSQRAVCLFLSIPQQVPFRRHLHSGHEFI